MTSIISNVQILRSAQRGRTQIGWLDSHHSFSFGEYHDPARMGFRSLRVINDDIIAPGVGFGEHPHRDMEIITWVLDGSLQHRDSLGNGAVITPGEVQVMTAGRGIRHSEFNPSPTQPVHLLQMWILPKLGGAEPTYGQTMIPQAARHNRFAPVVTGDGRDGTIRIQQDATLAIADLEAGHTASWRTAAGRHLYVHVARGSVELLDQTLDGGDAGAISEVTQLQVKAAQDSQVLLFDMA